ncbi:MAG: low affinity iron permease family protein [Beijerinckiaceae bacterium]
MNRAFTRFANTTARLAGKPMSFVICCAIIVTWAVTGPIFGYSDTWQLVINTGTTIVTFLMVFLIQNQQNRDGAAIQAKLDELIRALNGARNDLVGIEHLTDDEVDEILKALEKDAEGENSSDDRDGERKLQILRASFGRLSRSME